MSSIRALSAEMMAVDAVRRELMPWTIELRKYSTRKIMQRSE